MDKNIVLIGFMGTGKSSIGVRLAHRLKKQFVDVDSEIENITGMSVSEIFRRHGERRFRSEERLMAEKLGKRKGLVIATGGGLVLDKENVKALRENGILICLEASAQEIYERTNRKKGVRPLLKKDVTIADIERFLQQRKVHYACADMCINTTAKSMNSIVNEILQVINELENR